MKTIASLLLLSTLHCATAQPGTVDTTFHSRLLPGNGDIARVLALPDGKSLIGGWFTLYDGEPVGRIARLLPDGALDPSFTSNAGFDGSVFCMLRLTDGRMLVGGSFDTYDGVPCPRLARLLADGAFDATFQPEVSDLQNVRDLAVLPTGRILVSGSNLQAPFTGLRRLLPDGSIDPDFIAPDGILPTTFVLLANGRIMVGENTQTEPFHCLTRLLQNGSVDSTFTSGSFGTVGLSYAGVNVIHERADGSYIVGGHFESYDGVARRSLASIFPDGALNTDYTPIDASWTMVPMWWAEVSTILPCDGDKLMIPKFGFNARLQDDGTWDETFHRANAPFNFDPRLAFITGSARQPDGRILVAGAFDDIDSTGNRGIARLNDCVIGSPCDDGNPETIEDAVDPLCICYGELSTAITKPVDDPVGLMVVPYADRSGRFTIIGTFAGDPGPITLTMHDVLGRKIHDERIMMKSGPMRIEVSPAPGIASGIHVVSLRGVRFRWTQRLYL